MKVCGVCGCKAVAVATEQGASLERRRIRRAQRAVIAKMNTMATWDGCPHGVRMLAAEAVAVLGDATHTPRKGRKP
jgi:hypothetical protein